MNETDKKLYDQGFGIQAQGAGPRSPLKDRCLFSPFSTWNTRDAFWLQRRRAWLKLGIQSELGRDGKLTYAIPEKLADGSTGNKIKNQTSVFDPMLCELAYRWWSRPGAVVLDPFAGGSVRGIMASLMGLKYYGIDLRSEQIEANKSQLDANTTGKYKPRWVAGDSLVEVPKAPACDFVFSCPPYGDLEVYSDDPQDISNMAQAEFLAAYDAIILQAMHKLKPDSFAVWVVANYRDKRTGAMRDFVGQTIRAFEAAEGVRFYNDIVLINSVGSGAMRAGNTFDRGGRKMVKLHQNVLVFCKGDPKAAAAKLPADVIADF